MLPHPRGQTYPFAYGCSFTLHTPYKNGMIGHGGGGALSKYSKTKYHNNLSGTILYKPVGKCQFIMACIRALVMIAYIVD